MGLRRQEWPGAAVALALMALAAGCPEKPATSLDGGAGTGAPRSGVQVPLPSGWTARLAEDESLQAGPGGRPVLRVDIRPGQGKALPSAEALTEQVRQQFGSFNTRVEHTQTEQDASLVLVWLAPRLADGGQGPEALALFGARRAGGDLFLCASLPGASEEEVQAGLEACRKIEVKRPAR